MKLTAETGAIRIADGYAAHTFFKNEEGLTVAVVSATPDADEIARELARVATDQFARGLKAGRDEAIEWAHRLLGIDRIETAIREGADR